LFAGYIAVYGQLKQQLIFVVIFKAIVILQQYCSFKGSRAHSVSPHFNFAQPGRARLLAGLLDLPAWKKDRKRLLRTLSQ